MATHYDVLGVTPKAQPEEVRLAYRKLARAYHPDVNDDPKATERMAQINVAFEVLSDPVRRMEYDTSLGHIGFNEPSAEPQEANRKDSIHARVVQRHRIHRTPIYGVSFIQESGRLVSSSFDNEVIWWDQGLLTPLERMKLDGGVVSSLQTTPDGTVIAAGATEQSLACWTLDGSHPHVWRQTPRDWICCLKPSPDGASLGVGHVDGYIKVMSVESGALRWQGRKHKDSVTAVAWSADGSLIATGSADATVRIWCGITGRDLYLIERVRSTVTSLAFSPDGKWIAVGAVDLSLRVFRVGDLALRHTFFGHQKPIEALAFHPKSWLLGSASRDGSVGLWNVKFGIGHGQFEASHQAQSCIAFAPDGRHLVSGGLDKVLRVWRLSQPRG